MDKPFFSVVIPLYNKENNIEQTLKTAINQTFTDFEIIVVNDGSKDNSLAVVQKVKNARIRIIDKPNGGVSSARNRGILESKGEYIAFLDGDDLWKDNHLREVKKLIDTMPEAKLFATRHQISTRPIPSRNNAFYVRNYPVANIVENGKVGSGLICSTNVVVKKECFDKVGVFNEQYAYGEDQDMWRRLCQEYILAKSKQVTAIYVMNAENRASNDAVKDPQKQALLSRKYCKNYSEKIEYGLKLAYPYITFRKREKKSIKKILLNFDIVFFASIIYFFNRIFYSER